MRPHCFVAAVVLFALAPAVADAQGPDQSAVSGVIIDSSRAVIVDAKVTLTGSNLIGGPRRVSTGPDGRFRFSALAPGSYDVTAKFQGFRSASKRGVRLEAGATIVVDLVLDVAGISNAVEVGGSAPLVDVRSAAIPTHLDQDALQALPTSRWLPSIINLAPGVAGDVAFGGTQASNGMYVDGVDITEPHFQDVVGRINYNWIQEVQVLGLGASAQNGEFTGVSARSVLRSGSNRFSGLAEYWTTRPNWLAHNTGALEASLATSFESKKLLESWDTSAQLGGPILRDRLWFFAGFQRATEDSRPAGYKWTGSRREHDPRMIAKITAAVAPSVRFEGFISRSNYLVTGDGIDPWTPIESAWDTRQPQTTWNAGLTWSPRPQTLIELRGGGIDSVSHQDPHAPATMAGPAPRYDVVTGLYSGGVWWTYDWGGTRQTAALTLTQEVARALGGSHSFRFGVEIEHTTSTDAMRTPTGKAYLDYGGEPYMAYLGGDFFTTGRTTRTTAYLQDEWRLGSRLTLSPGVRISVNRGGPPSSPGFFSTTPVSMRLGAAWDVGAGHRTVVRAHGGRYFDATFSSRIGADSSQFDPTVVAMVTGPGQFEEVDRWVGDGNSDGVDPNIKHSYVDQFVVGVERQFGTNFSLQAQVIRRNFDVFMGMIDTGSTWAPTTLQDPGPDGIVGTPDDGKLLTVYRKTNPGNEVFLYTNPSGAYRRYSAVQVIGRKRLAHGWQLQASYTWSRAVGTVTNHWHSNAARYDLGNPGTYVNPNNGINSYGHAPFDFTHEVKVLGSYRVPWWGGVMVSAVYRAHTGYAWGRVVRAPLNLGTYLGIKTEPIGARRTAAINNLDMRLEKTIGFAHNRTLGVFVDAFNLGNQGVPNAEGIKPVVEMSGPKFGQPTKWIDPRSLRVGVRFSF